MSDYGGRLIRDTEPTVNTTTASGIWTIEEALKYKKAGTWPTPVYSEPNFKQTVLLLHGDGTNGAQNNTFLDSSTNNFTITRNGNTTQGTFSPFSVGAGEWSNYFDGSGDWLQITKTGGLNGTGDFTIEFWYYPVATTGMVFNSRSGGTNGDGIDISTTLNVTTSGAVLLSAITITTNTWTHVAIVRSGTTLSRYVNGTLNGSTTASQNFTGTTFMVGGSAHGNIGYLTGYMSNFRQTNSAVYTSNFTPPTTPLTAITNTSLLTCQSNRFVDNSTNAFTITRNGDVRVTPFSPFAPTAEYSAGTNGGSGYFSGQQSAKLRIPSSTNTNITGGAFTIECWVYYTGSGIDLIAAQDDGNSNGQTFQFRILSDNKVSFLYWTSSSRAANASVASTNAINLNSWNHVAVSYTGSTVYIFINGVENANTAVASMYSANVETGIGNYNTNGFGNEFVGYISDFRIIKGTALYTAAFTPPTTPLTAITNTSLLCNFTNAGIFDNTGKNNLETVGNAQIDTTTKKYGTGSLEFDGTGDYLSLRPTPELQLDSDNWTVEFWTYFNATNVVQDFFSQWNGSFAGSSYAFLYNNSNTSLEFYWYVSSSNNVSVSWTPSSATWYHIAFSKSGTTLRIFVNGIQQGSNQTVSTTPAISTQNVVVGGIINPARSMNGYIDDLRITKGVARYTANFTAPTAPFLDR